MDKKELVEQLDYLAAIPDPLDEHPITESYLEWAHGNVNDGEEDIANAAYDAGWRDAMFYIKTTVTEQM